MSHSWVSEVPFSSLLILSLLSWAVILFLFSFNVNIFWGLGFDLSSGFFLNCFFDDYRLVSMLMMFALGWFPCDNFVGDRGWLWFMNLRICFLQLKRAGIRVENVIQWSPWRILLLMNDHGFDSLGCEMHGIFFGFNCQSCLGFHVDFVFRGCLNLKDD